MTMVQIAYDHINKRLIAAVGEDRFSVSVRVAGTKHASISAAEVAAKTAGAIATEDFVKALKRFRNNSGKSFIVSVDP